MSSHHSILQRRQLRFRRAGWVARPQAGARPAGALHLASGHPGPSPVSLLGLGQPQLWRALACLCLWVFSGACLEGENDCVLAWDATCIKVWQLMTWWRWVFVTCWWKERESDWESPHGACGPRWLGPWLVCFCVLSLHLKICIYSIYLLGCLGYQLWQVGSCSLTRDPTWGPLPWEHRVLALGLQGSHSLLILTWGSYLLRR